MCCSRVHSPSDALTDDRFTRRPDDQGRQLHAAAAPEGPGRARCCWPPTRWSASTWSTRRSELQTHFANGERDIALLHGRGGEEGETVLRYASAPKVEVLAGKVTSALRRRPWRPEADTTCMTAWRACASAAAAARRCCCCWPTRRHSLRFWTPGHAARASVLQLTPALVRSASVRRRHAGTDAATRSEDSGPARSGGRPFAGYLQRRGAGLTRPAGRQRQHDTVKGPEAINLPDLAKLGWTRRMDSPEAQPAFDDSQWIKADHRASAAQTWTMPERGQPTLAMSDYGFHHGDVWYRGRIDIWPT